MINFRLLLLCVCVEVTIEIDLRLFGPVLKLHIVVLLYLNVLKTIPPFRALLVRVLRRLISGPFPCVFYASFSYLFFSYRISKSFDWASVSNSSQFFDYQCFKRCNRTLCGLVHWSAFSCVFRASISMITVASNVFDYASVSLTSKCLDYASISFVA